MCWMLRYYFVFFVSSLWELCDQNEACYHKVHQGKTQRSQRRSGFQLNRCVDAAYCIGNVIITRSFVFFVSSL